MLSLPEIQCSAVLLSWEYAHGVTEIMISKVNSSLIVIVRFRFKRGSVNLDQSMRHLNAK